MPDKVTYPAPIGGQVLAGTQELRPNEFHAFFDQAVPANCTFTIVFSGDNGVRRAVDFVGQEAFDKIVEMNSKDFSALHMKKWFGQIGVASGQLPVGGTAT